MRGRVEHVLVGGFVDRRLGAVVDCHARGCHAIGPPLLVRAIVPTCRSQLAAHRVALGPWRLGPPPRAGYSQSLVGSNTTVSGESRNECVISSRR